jgi:hypothetical protein
MNIYKHVSYHATMKKLRRALRKYCQLLIEATGVPCEKNTSQRPPVTADFEVTHAFKINNKPNPKRHLMFVFGNIT